MADQNKIPLECLDELHKLESKIREAETKTAFNKMLSLADNLRTSMTMITNHLTPLEKDIKEAIDDADFKNKVDVAYKGLSIKINFQLQQSFNLLYSQSSLLNHFAECIESLIKIIDSLYSDKEEQIAEQINPLEPEVQEPEQPKQETIIQLKEETLPETKAPEVIEPQQETPIPPKEEISQPLKEQPKQPTEKIEPKKETIIPEEEFENIFETRQETNEEVEDPEEEEEEAVNVSNYMFKCEKCKNDFKSLNDSGCPRCGKTKFQTKYLT